MINYREIFDISYSYIGLIIIGIVLLLIFFLDKMEGVKTIFKSFLLSGGVLLFMYFIGGLLVNSIKYSFFIEVITDNFFNNIIIFSIISLIIGGGGLGIYKYIEK